WSPERAISEKALFDPRVARILAVIRDAEDMPRDWNRGKDAWIRHVALKHGVARQTVYRWLAKYDKRGIAGIEHRKSTAGQAKAWTPEALDWWVGLTLKPEHRKVSLRALYDDILVIEAHRRGWRIGSYESAIWWYEKRVTPALRALRDGGLRALDNILPPVLRDYSDLAPFEMLVGDQHRFDFWVVDDETGKLFRPECYAWLDLRTRLVYGIAFDRRYDAHLCGEALRIGMRIWGCFNAIYTDNGSSELSKYMTGIMSGIRAMGMEWKRTIDTPMDVLDVDGEEIQPVVQEIAPGTHKKAIVKNAKAKMIEKFFDIVEEVLRSHFRLPGSVKRLSDDIHTQDLDHQEAMKLAEQGKLLLASEFYMRCYDAVDYYNRQKPHRGVLKEWIWKPKPVEATPYDCLMACIKDGWRPRWISDEAADLLFLERRKRVVQRGRVTVDNDWYEHDALLEMHGQQVEVRFRPYERDLALIYQGGKFICAASQVEYSSMKDGNLAERKIMDKREKRRAIAEKFRTWIKGIPDLRQYSEVPEAEKVAALVGNERRRIEAARANESRSLTAEELAEKVAELERLNERLPDGRTAAFAMTMKSDRALPPRPTFFLTDTDRFLWCLHYEAAGGHLSHEDRAFLEEQFASMTPEARERWNFEREYGGLS
ncbi:MAG TPA: Mu transposase C-terminal domain-containing protein, partial [Methanothrix sp.]|nr:Mu transposase C-terminal domain-containing protein [Methanothrix sp.]